MNTTMILLIIGGSILVFIIGIIVLTRLSSRKKAKKLDLNLKKLNSEKESLKDDEKISFQPYEEEMPVKEEIENPEEKSEENLNDLSFLEGNEEDSYLPKNFYNKETQQIDDFDKFMEEHSYSRKIFNKPLLEKIKKLPPEVRMLLLSNVFDRIDDK